MNNIKQVFISHATNDVKVATSLYDYLEANNINCWIASRNITAGKDYTQSIMEAITSSAIIILIFSSSSNSSRHVKTEIERAFHHNLVIIPFRIENISPGQSMEYLLSNSQWLDGFNDKPEKYFPSILKSCSSVLNLPVQSDKNIEQSLPQNKRPATRSTGKIISIVAVACLLLIAAVFFINYKDKPGAEANENSHTIDSSLLKQPDTIQTVKDTVKPKSRPAEITNIAASPTVVTENKVIKSKAISAETAALITGSFWKPDGADELTFTENDGKIFFSGRVGGKSIASSELSAEGSTSFAIVSSAIKGSLHFSSDYNNLSGTITGKNILSPLTVNLERKENTY